MLRIKIMADLLLDRTPWVKEIRAGRRQARAKMDAQRKMMARYDDSINLPRNPMHTKPLPPKFCCVCKAPACSLLPTENTFMAYVMNPLMSMCIRDKELIEQELAIYHSRYGFKWFCRTHKLGYQEDRFKA